MRFILVLLTALLCAGCASITRGTTVQFQIISNPDGADVRTSMGNTCNTPCTLTFGRKDEFSLTFSKPGYQSQTVQVGTRLAGTGAAGLDGNVLFGGVIGIGVDAYNGAELEHFPNPVAVDLVPARSPQPAAPPRSTPKPARPKVDGVPQG